jgi:hypothetical protein
VRQEEIEEESRERKRRLTDHPLLPHLITLGAATLLNLIALSFFAGSQNRSIDENTDDIKDLKARMSPAAAQAIGEIRVYDAALDRRISNLEAQFQAQRVEMMQYLQRIDQNLQHHLEGERQ